MAQDSEASEVTTSSTRMETEAESGVVEWQVAHDSDTMMDSQHMLRKIEKKSLKIHKADLWRV